MIRHLGALSLLSLLAAPTVYAATSYQVNNGASLNITEHTVCRTVTNNAGNGLALFVPTNTAGEWSSFYTNPPTGVTAVACSLCTPGTNVYNTAGSTSWVVPADCTQMTVYAWGAGGGGGNGSGTSSGGTAGAGGYATSVITVTPGQTITINVGGAGNGGASGCASVGTGGSGGTGGYAGGSAAINAAGTVGSGNGTGGTGGTARHSGTVGGDGKYGGGGAGSGPSSGNGGGGGGATVISRGGNDLVIAGGGGGGAGREGDPGSAGAGGPGCAVNGSNGNGGPSGAKGGGGGGGACLGTTTANGTGDTPFAITTPASLPPAANAGGGAGNNVATCNTGEPGYVRIDFQ